MKKLLLSLIIISAITSCAKKEDEIKSESSTATPTDNSSSINCENYVFDNSSITDNTTSSNLDTKVQIDRPSQYFTHGPDLAKEFIIHVEKVIMFGLTVIMKLHPIV